MTSIAVDVAFARSAEEPRVKSLETLRDLLQAAEGEDLDRESFRQLFATALLVLELDQDDAAGIVKASRPTVSRWISGTAVPHRVGRPSVFRELRKVAADKLKQHSPTSPARELVCA